MNEAHTETNAEQVASYFIGLQDDNAGDLISNLKLQKLLYYAQGLYLAMHEMPLFPESIEAWTYGPVVPSVYHTFKNHGASPIPYDSIQCTPIGNEDIKDFLSEIYTVFGQYSAWKLRDMTHQEKPYLDMQERGGEISHESMRECFKQYLVNDSE